MRPLKELSGKVIVIISLLVWFLTSSFLLVQFGRNSVGHLQALLLLPAIYGFTILAWFKALLDHRWSHWPTVIIISVALPFCLVMLMLRHPRWRPLILAFGLIIACVLTAAAYLLLLA